MLGLDTELKQTRFYQETAREDRQEGRKEESITLLTRQLRRKFGLQSELDAALQQLPNMALEQLEDLADALLDFKSISDLQTWLNLPSHSNQPILNARLLDDGWITLDNDTIRCQIKRIDDNSFYELDSHTLAINVRQEYWWDYLRVSQNPRLKAAPLAFFLATFEYAYKPSGHFYDHYKGAFSFPFAVNVLHHDMGIPYLLHVTCWRGEVEFRFRKIISADETRYDKRLEHKPFDDEFSEYQMSIVAKALLRLAEDKWQSNVQNNQSGETAFPGEESLRDFVKAIDSNNILFGCKNGQFFEKHYSNQNEYEQMKNELLLPYQRAQYQKTFGKHFCLRQADTLDSFTE